MTSTSDHQPATSPPPPAENPLARHGKVSYLEIPALDVDRSAEFYGSVFGWTITGGHADAQRRSFEDASSELIGAFVTGREISSEPGILPFVYVTGIEHTVRDIAANGGEVVRPVYEQGDLWVTEFRDPAGNLIGVWQFRDDDRGPS